MGLSQPLICHLSATGLAVVSAAVASRLDLDPVVTHRQPALSPQRHRCPQVGEDCSDARSIAPHYRSPSPCILARSRHRLAIPKIACQHYSCPPHLPRDKASEASFGQNDQMLCALPISSRHFLQQQCNTRIHRSCCRHKARNNRSRPPSHSQRHQQPYNRTPGTTALAFCFTSPQLRSTPRRLTHPVLSRNLLAEQGMKSASMAVPPSKPWKLYCFSNSLLLAPHVGHTQSSGSSSKGVPGTMSFSGSPFSGS